jgi:hypothetical protein
MWPLTDIQGLGRLRALNLIERVVEREMSTYFMHPMKRDLACAQAGEVEDETVGIFYTTCTLWCRSSVSPVQVFKVPC